MSWRELSKSEQEKALKNTVTAKAVIRSVDELTAGIFTVVSDSTVVDVDDDKHILRKGEKVKLLEEGEHDNADWLYRADDVSVLMPGGVVGTLKKGIPLAVLEPNYKEMLRKRNVDSTGREGK